MMSVTKILLMLSLLLLVLLPHSLAEDGGRVDNVLCGQHFADAYETGFASFKTPVASDLRGPNATVPNVTWAITVFENSSTSQWATWIDFGSANYSDAANLGYNVCAVVVVNTTLETNYHGQQDNGTCLTAFDVDCVDALNSAATAKMGAIVQDNPTAQARLPNLCTQLAEDIRTDFPSECAQYYNTSVYTIGSALTSLRGENNKLYSSHCNLNDSYYNFEVVWAPHGTIKLYDQIANVLWPVLTVFSPVLTDTGTIFGVQSKLSCLHPTHYVGDSYRAPSLTPPPEHHNLSGSDIAGIVIASVAGVIISAALIWWFWRRQIRASESNAVGCKGSRSVTELEGDHSRVEIANGEKREELPTSDISSQLETNAPYETFEMPGSIPEPAELQSTTAGAEHHP